MNLLLNLIFRLGRQIFPVILLLFFAQTEAVAQSSPISISGVPYAPSTIGKNYVEGEILVKFKKETKASLQSQVINNMEGTHSKSLSRKGLVHLKIKKGGSLEEAILDFEGDSNVEYAQPNYIYHTMATPNDSHYGELWGLKNTAQTISNNSYSTNNPGTSGKDIDAELAWNLITDCSSTIVAVIDSGVNYNHGDLANNMWDGSSCTIDGVSSSCPKHGYDFVDTTNDNDPMDLNGHGTHVAGTIGAIGNNSSGISGICWNASIMAVRVLNTLGLGTTADIIEGVNFAVENGAKVINMSLGGSNYDAASLSAYENARRAGVLLIVAAGNAGVNNDVPNHTYPCDYDLDNIICVAALDQNYNLATFSNYGATSVDVGAPGTNIISSWNGINTNTTDDFSAGWTFDGWTGGTTGSCPSCEEMLYNPSDWYGGTYANDLTNDAYKTFTIAASTDAVTLEFWAFVHVESNADSFNINYINSDTNPFVSGVQLASLAGDSGGSGSQSMQFAFELPDCKTTTTCAIGFGLSTNSSIVGYGVGIYAFNLKTLSLNTNSFHTINGTSMATPHVAGMAAMIWAYNSGYNYLDVVASVQNSGETQTSLASKTTSGKSVNAYNSLLYIQTPTGITATLQ